VEENMKKNMLFFINLSGLILLAIFLFPHSSLSITSQDIQKGPQLDTSQESVRVERIVVKEIGDNSITSLDGRIIRFDSSTKVFKNLNKESKMRTAELHYVDGRLVAIYIM
jgi:hypothetical protein